MSDENDPERKGEALGLYLKTIRSGTGLTLRDVEEATAKEVSNAYLSQLENGKIAKPSPNILHALSGVYKVSYAKMMERAGYISPKSRSSNAEKHGKAATFSIENLTVDEEKELLQYLNFVRQKAKSG
jgi:HTH-type transcriptional regulator, competence development regulator